MILHLMHNDKFNEPFIRFINKNFDISSHLFLYDGGSSNINIKIPEADNVLKNNKVKNRYLKFFETFLVLNGYVYKSKKIILHGLFNPRILLFLLLQPWLLRKCNWVIWGGDLYCYEESKNTIIQILHEYMRAFCIKRFDGLITYVKGDYELAKKWYGAKGKYYECIMYPSNLYKELEVKRIENDDKICIQIGNSADPSNKHLEILERLQLYKNENIEIICPLSYGDKEYANTIKKIGEEKFGRKFLALMDFIPFEKYLQILGKIDIAIFNHSRQQGMGNIITLLGLGKKVYLREGITTEQMFQEKNIKVYNNKNLDIYKIEDRVKIENVRLVESYFSEISLYNQWKDIFEGERYDEN